MEHFYLEYEMTQYKNFIEKIKIENKSDFATKRLETDGTSWVGKIHRILSFLTITRDFF